jgi:hypothetical protein
LDYPSANGVVFKVAVRNQKSEAVLDIKGIPMGRWGRWSRR